MTNDEWRSAPPEEPYAGVVHDGGIAKARATSLLWTLRRLADEYGADVVEEEAACLQRDAGSQP